MKEQKIIILSYGDKSSLYADVKEKPKVEENTKVRNHYWRLIQGVVSAVLDIFEGK